MKTRAWLWAVEGEKRCLISLEGIRRVVIDPTGGSLRLIYTDGSSELLTCQDTHDGFDVWATTVVEAITKKDLVV